MRALLRPRILARRARLSRAKGFRLENNKASMDDLISHDCTFSCLLFSRWLFSKFLLHSSATLTTDVQQFVNGFRSYLSAQARSLIVRKLVTSLIRSPSTQSMSTMAGNFPAASDRNDDVAIKNDSPHFSFRPQLNVLANEQDSLATRDLRNSFQASHCAIRAITPDARRKLETGPK